MEVLKYFNGKLSQIGLFAFLTLSLASCGTYQSVYNTDDDGIYNSDDQEDVVIVNDNSNFDKNYFSRQLEDLQNIDQNDSFTNIDDYFYDKNANNYKNDSISINDNAPWEYSKNVVVNIDNSYDGFDYYWYNPFYYSYYDYYPYYYGNPYYYNYGYSPFYYNYYGGYGYGYGGYGYYPYYYPYGYYNGYYSNYYRSYGKRAAYNTYRRGYSRNSLAKNNYTNRYSTTRRSSSTSTRKNTPSTRRRTNSNTNRNYNRTHSNRQINRGSHYNNSSIRRSSGSGGYSRRPAMRGRRNMAYNYHILSSENNYRFRDRTNTRNATSRIYPKSTVKRKSYSNSQKRSNTTNSRNTKRKSYSNSINNSNNSYKRSTRSSSRPSYSSRPSSNNNRSYSRPSYSSRSSSSSSSRRSTRHN